ncbi:hypothetical protein PAPHI01_0160 [Pancytospora philotis]|nr:hypothetical protein PAPHI01_0160 [Pancytospora philotis]
MPRMEDSAEQLARTHAVKSSDKSIAVRLNKPADFVYDISDVVLVYEKGTGKYAVTCPELPAPIIRNILSFQGPELASYVQFIEEHLSEFCMGRRPAPAAAPRSASAPSESAPQPTDGLHALPSAYKFPLSTNVTPNLKFDSMKSNILVFTCREISLTVECNKCHTIETASQSSACKKCHAALELTYVPCFSHDHLGFLALKGCRYVAFGPSRFQLSCAGCQSNYETPSVGIGRKYVFKCFSCFVEIAFVVEQVVYAQKKDYKLVAGAELPNKGTCKHYKKSYRWFRFSCCNALYPCDICHNEDAKHPCEEAKRMVCGLCSKEQSVNKECDCGMSLKKAHAQFWEGGKGNRDKSTMSRKDTKKFHR